MKPKLTRGDSILGTRGITPGDRVDEATINCLKMMRDFQDNNQIQFYTAKAMKFLARMSLSSKENLKKNSVSKQLSSA